MSHPDGSAYTLTRRRLLTYGIILPQVAPSLLYISASSATDLPSAAAARWPEFWIRRESDELFLHVVAIGYRESHNSSLEPLPSSRDLFLSFTFPSQHFAESALPLTEIPLVFKEADLTSIQLSPSRPSTLVFRVRHRTRLKLALEDLLAWEHFDLVLPDLDKVGQRYDLDIPDTDPGPSTRVEMPWGIKLSPTRDGADKTPYTFTSQLRHRSAGAWSELWTAALTNPRAVDRTKPIPMEVLGVTGFDRVSESGSVNEGNLTVTYQDHPGEGFPQEPTPLSNYDRIDIATSLSRRFPYRGQVGPPPIDSAYIAYQKTQGLLNASAPVFHPAAP
jgi:hypothetical protein